MTTGPPIEELHFQDAPAVDDPPGPAARRLLDRQRAEESGIVLYPNDLPFAPEAAKGATVRDADGNVFIDCYAGIGVMNVGHANPHVLAGVEQQSRELVHTLDFPTETRLDLVETFDRIVPAGLRGANRVAFGGPTGSDAVEATIKIAKRVTGGTGLIAFRGAYHGGTAGALSLTADIEEKEAYTPLLADVQHLRYPYPFAHDESPERAVERSLAEVRETLEDPYGGLANPAGIWVEPIQGEGGVIVPPEGFLSGLRAIADEHDIPLVVDEVQAGFGRTGAWFACEHEGVTPDVMPVAKGIGNGHPLSATVYREEYALEPGDHSGTFRGYLPAMRACVRAVEYIEDHDLLGHAADLGDHLLDRLRAEVGDHPAVGEVRGQGLYIGVEFVDDEGEPDSAARDAVRRGCFDRGVLVWGGGRRRNVVRLIPPLVLTREQAGTVVDALAASVRAL
jgi:diaminobutyrate-2-oxoglutarate transaminase